MARPPARHWRQDGAIRRIDASRHPAALIATLAGAQDGPVATWQLLALGLSRSAVDRRARIGSLHPMHHGVYAVGHPVLSFRGGCMAAALALGAPGALALPGRHPALAVPEARVRTRLAPLVAVTAAHAIALHGLGPEPGGPVRLLTAGAARSSPGIRGTRTALLGADDLVAVGAVPTASVARSLLDLAATADEGMLARAWREAAFRRMLDLRAVDAQIARGCRGTRALRGLRERTRGGRAPERSDFELALRRLASAARLDPPRINAFVTGASGRRYEADASWPSLRLIVECDGFEGHGTREAFEVDRARDADLLVAGWRTLRITWRRLEREPAAVARQLRALLRSAGALAS